MVVKIHQEPDSGPLVPGTKFLADVPIVVDGNGNTVYGSYSVDLDRITALAGQGPQGPAGQTGPQGAAGPQGQQGLPGNTILQGQVDPVFQGSNGDTYVNTLSGDVFAKNNGVWAKTGNIRGPAGPAGANGTNGTNGTDGVNGTSIEQGTVNPTNAVGHDGDTYLNTLTGDVFFRAAGAWAKTGNIMGPVGPQGPAGGQQTITISGDASGSGISSIALTLAPSGVTAGTYNSLVVNAKGLVTSGANVAGGGQTTTITGDASGTGTTSIALTLASVGTPGTYAKVVTDYAGRVTGTATLSVSDVSGAAPLASPALTGAPTAPTASAGDNSTTLATTAFVKSQGYLSNIGGTTGALQLPSGTTAQEPTGIAGMARYNITTSRFEFYNGASWMNHVRLAGDTMTGNLTISSGGLTVSAGSVALASASAVTVPTVATSDNSTNAASTAYVHAQGYATWTGAPVSIQLSWSGGATISNDTYYFHASLPFGINFTSLYYVCGTGSFMLAVNNGANAMTLAGASTLAVSNTTATTAAITGSYAAATSGSSITAVITGATGSPTHAILILNGTRA